MTHRGDMRSASASSEAKATTSSSHDTSTNPADGPGTSIPLNSPSTTNDMPAKVDPPKKRPATLSLETDEPKSKKRKTSTTDEAVASPSHEPVTAAVHADMTDAPSETVTSAKDAATTVATPKSRPKITPRGRAPIKTLFTPWKPTVDIPTVADPTWGATPYRDQAEPQARPGLLAARHTNAQTVTPLWEDRKFKFAPGRFHKSFPPGEDTIPEDGFIGPLLDQEENLVIKLMDMRPISKHNQSPRRRPVIYCYENGKPRDWDNLQVIKALNDRRREAIWRITLDPPWTEHERYNLSDIVTNYPDAGVEEWADRFNWRFQGDFKETTAFGWCEFHPGRSLESVVHEYRLYKNIYDEDLIPDPKREEGDKTGAKKQNNKKVLSAADICMAKFDKPARSRVSTKKQKEEAVIESDTQPEPTTLGDGPKLSDGALAGDHDEELLELAGYYNPNEIRDASPLTAAERAASIEKYGKGATGPTASPSHSVSPETTNDDQGRESRRTSSGSQASRPVSPRKSRSHSPRAVRSTSPNVSKSASPRSMSTSAGVSKSRRGSKSSRSTSPKIGGTAEEALLEAVGYSGSVEAGKTTAEHGRATSPGQSGESSSRRISEEVLEYSGFYNEEQTSGTSQVDKADDEEVAKSQTDEETEEEEEL